MGYLHGNKNRNKGPASDSRLPACTGGFVDNNAHWHIVVNNGVGSIKDGWGYWNDTPLSVWYSDGLKYIADNPGGDVKITVYISKEAFYDGKGKSFPLPEFKKMVDSLRRINEN